MSDKVFIVDSKTWKKAGELFGRSKESLDEDVETVKNWLKTQPHLPEIMEDIKIKNFLLLNKCSIEKTKQKIDMYYTIRSLVPDMYNECNPNLPHMKKFLDYMYVLVMPKLIDDLYRVIYINVKEKNGYAPKEGIMYFTNLNEIRLYEDCMVGDIWIVDFLNFTLKDILKLTPTLFAKMIATYQNVFSLRLKMAYFINSPSYVNHFLGVLKLILKPKIFNRIQVYEDAEILKTVFSKNDLPKEYGGDGPSLQEMQDNLNKKMEEYQNRFDVLDNLKVNESLRPEKLKDDDLLGFYGNFKKLTVD